MYIRMLLFFLSCFNIFCVPWTKKNAFHEMWNAIESRYIHVIRAKGRRIFPVFVRSNEQLLKTFYPQTFCVCAFVALIYFVITVIMSPRLVLVFDFERKKNEEKKKWKKTRPYLICAHYLFAANMSYLTWKYTTVIQVMSCFNFRELADDHLNLVSSSLGFSYSAFYLLLLLLLEYNIHTWIVATAIALNAATFINI